MRPFPALFVLTSLAATASADVITVGPSGADFTQIQPAIDAAAPGDIVFLRPAPQEYHQGGFTVAGKGITIVSEFGLAYVYGPVAVRDVPPGPALVLRNLVAGPIEAQALRVENCAGPVRLEWMTAATFLAGSPASFDTMGSIVDCADVAGYRFNVSDSDVINQVSSLTGLRLVRSRLVGVESEFRGTRGVAGSGLGGNLLPGGTGATGLHVIDSQVFLRSGRVRGGSGGNGLAACQPPTLFPTAGGDGGFAISIASGAVELKSGVLAGGNPGPGGAAGNCVTAPNGASGVALDDPNGLVTTPSGPVRTLRTSHGLVREGGAIDVTVTTAPGDTVHLVTARRTGVASTPSIEGQQLVVEPMTRRLLGTASGNQLVVSVPFGELGAGIEGKTVHMQAVVVGANGQATWSNLSSVAWVDASF